MKIARNDPCPCGSGKKYKACCKVQDEVRARARALIGEDAFDEAEATWTAAAREAEVWAADLAPTPGYFGKSPDAVPSLVMVTAAGFVVHSEMLPYRPAGPGERARAVAAAVNAATRVVGVLPRRLEVPHEELVEALGHELVGRGVRVEYGDPEDLFEAMNEALASVDPGVSQGKMAVALTWRETEASGHELADFHEAAAAFYAAAPWASEETEGPFLLDLPRESHEHLPGLDLPERHQWAASVMGSMGESFGLALYSQPSDLADILTADNSLEAALEAIGFSITVDFDRKSELTRPMQREIAAARWPIAGSRAYPRLFGFGLPGRRVTARDVRLATLALRAIAVHACGGDTLAETGVAVTPFDPEAEVESREDWFRFPDQAQPIGPEGPGAELEAGLRAWDTDEQGLQVEAAEEERFGRFVGWLEGQERSDVEKEADRQNARHWADFLGRILPAGAVTEYDLRLFLYNYYPRKADATVGAIRELPRSMRVIVRFLEEREGIRYPFASGVLEELEGIEARAREQDEPLEDTLKILSYDIYEYLNTRVLLPVDDSPGVPGGWPELMTIEVAQLRQELQRRWLLWFEGIVRNGEVDHAVLEEELEALQREWETTPHPRVDGRTPAEVVAAQQEL
ncbi:MAG TPA: SEC-C metal-binding domain-containing protein [Longimicrobium sp.]